MLPSREKKSKRPGETARYMCKAGATATERGPPPGLPGGRVLVRLPGGLGEAPARRRQ